jgi:hypothetical protein
LQLARQAAEIDTGTVARTLGNAFQGGLVASTLALGLILGTRLVLALAGERQMPIPCHLDGDGREHLAGNATQGTPQ